MASFNTKYGAKGCFDTRALANIRGPPQLVMALADTLNHGLARNTWKSYKMSANHVLRIRKELGIALSFPFSLEDTLTYIGYLLSSSSASPGS